jgi:hypothetical protein
MQSPNFWGLITRRRDVSFKLQYKPKKYLPQLVPLMENPWKTDEKIPGKPWIF